MKILTLAFLTITQIAFAQELRDFAKCEIDSIDGHKVYTITEVSPQYEGGLQKFYQDLSRKLRIRNHEGSGCVKIVMSFVVDVDGKVKKFCTSNNITVDPEVVESIDKWSPGLIGGNKVAVRLIVPCYIKLG